MNRKLIAPVAAAVALALWGCGPDADRTADRSNAASPPPPVIAQSPDATRIPAPNERPGDSSPSPSRGMEERASPGGLGSPAPASPETRSLSPGQKPESEAQPIPGSPSSDKDKNSKNSN